MKIRTTRVVGAGRLVDAAFWKRVPARDTREHKLRLKYDWTDGAAADSSGVQRLAAELKQAQAEIRTLSALVAASSAVPQQTSVAARTILDGDAASILTKCPPSYHKCVDVEARAANYHRKGPSGSCGAQAGTSSGLFEWLFRMCSRATGSLAVA